MGIQVFYNHLPAGTVKDIEVCPMGTHNESRTAKGEQAILRALGIDAPAK